MKNKILAFVHRHQLLTKDSTVLIGVSGGPDSMALLHFLCSIREAWNLELIAISVDHQLRGEEAQADLHYVQEQCAHWQVKFVGTSVDVPSYKQERHVGTQIAARALRYQCFEEQMNKFQADYLALGHHGDDQVETMLMNLVRSASSSAFSGIPVKRHFATGFIIRPFLCVTKPSLQSYCNENQIIPRIDPSNEETTYTRNYFRKHLLPLIKNKNSNIHTTVQRLSESFQEDERFLQDEAAKVVSRVVTFSEKGEIASFEIDLFKSHAHALQRRAYHLILNYLYNTKLPENLSYVHEAQFFALLEANKGNVQIDFPRNLKLEKSYQKLNFFFQSQTFHIRSFQEKLNIPEEVELPDGSKVTAIYTDIPREQDEYTYLCVSEEIAMPLHIRTRQAGDRMGWKGLDGSKKIKDIFIDAKIPRKERETWPLVTDNNGAILWLIGLKKGQPKIQAKEGTLYIQLNYKKGNV